VGWWMELLEMTDGIGSGSWLSVLFEWIGGKDWQLGLRNNRE
jgi:hypothetical protein